MQVAKEQDLVVYTVKKPQGNINYDKNWDYDESYVGTV